MKAYKSIANIILMAICLYSCSGPTAGDTTYVFEDGFENNGGEFLSLFPADGSRWTNVQLVTPETAADTNRISLSLMSSEGDYSVQVEAATSSETVLSKCDIEKFGFQAYLGQQIIIEADFYIEGTQDLENLFLIDLECCSCWDPDVPDNQCPGIRLKMAPGDFLVVERGKILLPTINQSAVSFPRNQWVSVVWTLDLSDEESGSTTLEINGAEALSSSGITMPVSSAFTDTLATAGFDFQLQQPLFYERVQFGATANASAADINLWLDNVRIEIRNPE